MAETTKYRTELPSPPFDSVVSSLANRQYGIVTLAQLEAIGLSESGVRSRVAAGRLHRLHRGVYAVGHRVVTREARWFAAVMACGPGAVLSHRSAASLWGLRHSQGSSIDVSSVRHAGRLMSGIDAHVVRCLAAQDVTRVGVIPCTTVARSLLDLADVVDRQTLERALDRAEVLQVFDMRALEDVLARGTGRRGAPVLRAILQEYDVGATVTESELEERFLALCTNAGLPRPRVNAWINLDKGSARADFLWARQKLVVETDGRRVHGTRRAFERDRRRDQLLLLAGYRVLRFTWSQIVDGADEVAETVSALLATE